MAKLAPRTGSLHCYRDPAELAEQTATALAELITTVTETGRPFRVALSGGSTPQRLYRLLAKMDLPWDSIHWFWGDERNVPHDHGESNYRMVREALLDRVPVPPETVFPVPIQVDDPAKAARDYDQILRDEAE